jgi:2-keto-3-deoxy-L-fuconate dehydrogenase
MIRTIRAVLPGMLERGGRRSSTWPRSPAHQGRAEPLRLWRHQGGGHRAHQGVAADYVAKGIRCNAICPGTVESPSLQDRMRAQGDYDAARAAFIARQPMGRLGTPEEIADLAVTAPMR